MTKKQKSIADCLLESPEDIAYITLVQLSKKTASSELTLLRFCQKLGYANFLEMKNAFREYTQNMVKLLSSPQYFVPDATITDENGKSELLREICKEESEACKSFSPRWICWQSSPPPRPSAAASASLSVRTTSPMCWRSFWRQG